MILDLKELYTYAVLSGTKYDLKQTRGKFGLGAKMVSLNILALSLLFYYVSSRGCKLCSIWLWLCLLLCFEGNSNC